MGNAYSADHKMSLLQITYSQRSSSKEEISENRVYWN